jgi:preprotein translocase subunit YajC
MGSAGFLLIVLAFAFLWLVLVRPQKRRQQAQQRMLNDLREGDEVVTAGGLYGEIREVRDEEVLVRIAPEVDVRVARRAIAGIFTTHDEPAELEPAEEPERSDPTPGT